MSSIVIPLALSVLGTLVGTGPAPDVERDSIGPSGSEVALTFIGHGSLMMQYGGKTVYVDPWSKLADYAALPKADLVLITHHHADHLDTGALASVRTGSTSIISTRLGVEKIKGGTVLNNGERQELGWVTVEAVPAYNLEHMRPDGTPFHPKGEGNGYILTFGKARLYVAGDTENVPEMKALKNIDVAFLPMNLPYTMTPAMVADAARAFKPRILYPYHYGETDPKELTGLMKGVRGVEVRIRKMK